MLRRFVAFLCIMAAAQAIAVPLETYSDFLTANPGQGKFGLWNKLLVRGTGTNDFYILEVDPTTGKLPVDASVSIGNDTDYGTVGANTLRTAAQIGNANGAADFGQGAVSAQTLRSVSVLSTGSSALDYGAGNASAATLRTVLATDQAAIPVSQSGNWNIQDITGTISLPTGAATEATLSSIDTKVATETTLSSIDTSTTSIDTTTTALNGKIANDYGASTGAVRTASQLGNTTGAVDYNSGAASAQTLRTVLATRHESVSTPLATQLSNGTGAVDYGSGAAGTGTLRTVLATRHESVTTPIAAQISNGTSAIDFGSGADSAATIRNVLATRHETATTPLAVRISNGTAFTTPQATGRAYGDSVRLDYSGTNVTTGAWVELIASTAADINDLQIFDSCGEVLELGTGAAAAESRVLLIPPGGFGAGVPLRIASGTRVAIRAVSANCTSGQIVITGLN